MYSAITPAITFISCLVISGTSWGLDVNPYKKDCDLNKQCPDEERISLISSIQNEDLCLDQCFSQVWEK